MGRIAVFGHPFRLFDTAGIRPASDPVEVAGMRIARETAESAAVIIHVIDGRRALAEQGFPTALGEANGSATVIPVINKVDAGLVVAPAQVEQTLRRPALCVSALTGEGLDTLRTRVLAGSPFRGPATRHLPVPFTERQVRHLERALALLCAEPGSARLELLSFLDGACH
jgi:tRNA U34 5-carboxymethylaminomethyl modifying GTPase MnmE/TrmE